MEPIESDRTIPGAFFSSSPTTESEGGSLLTRDKLKLSRDKFKEAAGSLALSLVGLGITPGERVAIMLPNSPEWIITDLAVSAIGAVSVPIYSTLTAFEAAFILGDSAVSALVFSPDQKEKLAYIKKEVPSLRSLICTGSGIDGSVSFLSLRERAFNPVRLSELVNTVKAEDLFTIVYTSGTTGRPKGVELTHRNILSNISSVLEVIDIRAEDLYLSYLPLSHIFERMIHHLLIIKDASIAYSSGFAYVGVDSAFFKPTLMAGVPFFFERVKTKIVGGIEASGPFKRRLLKGLANGALEGKRDGLLRKMAKKKIREKVGPRIRFFISGGAPLAKETADFFASLGLPVIEGYGLTETSPVISVNTLTKNHTGTVGRPLPGTELRHAPDG